jgi:hypothetical protein
MDTVEIASYLIQAQAGQSQLDVATAVIKDQMDVSAQIVTMLESGGQAGTSTDGGQLLNTYA